MGYLLKMIAPPLSALSKPNFQKSFLSGTLRHKTYVLYKFQVSSLNRLAWALICQSVSQDFCFYIYILADCSHLVAGSRVFSPLTPHPCGVSIPLLRKDVHLCPLVPLLKKDVYLWSLEGSLPGKLHCDVGCSACKDISENHCRPLSALSKPNFKKSFLSGCLHCVRNVPAKFQVCRFYSSGDFVMSEWVSGISLI